MISPTRAMVSSVWEVDSLPGLGGDSPKAACSNLYISAPVFRQMETEIDAHAAAFSPPS